MILFGLTFLLGAFDVLSVSTVGVIWPILVILAGVGGLMDKKCCKAGDGGSGA